MAKLKTKRARILTTKTMMKISETRSLKKCLPAKMFLNRSAKK